MPSIIMSMLGAREHYAPVIMAERAGWLDCFVTDFWSGRSGPARYLVGLRGAGRYVPEIPDERVRTLTYLGLRYKWLLSRASDRARQYQVFEEIGSRFAMRTCEFLSADHDVFFGFSSASLETLSRAEQLGMRTVLDQIDPAKVEYDLVVEEERRYPDLTAGIAHPPASYFGRIQREWELANAVVVNSEWSKAALQLQGVPAEKIYIAPLTYVPSPGVVARDRWRENLRVLWLGTLCLRKGLPYALEAAERTADLPVRFTFAGSCDVQMSRLRLPKNAEYIGPVPRSAASKLYADHDLFLFPTLSDGFGLTQLEAMAHGLPVITTSNCGDVVEAGKSGLIVPVRDATAIVGAIRRFLEDLDLLPAMSGAALRRADDFRPAAVWPNYAAAIAAKEPVAA